MMSCLFILVFVIKSPIKTWLTSPTYIPNEYKVLSDLPYEKEYGMVTSVSDGDTIVVDDTMTIRLLGIDTPELAHADLNIREECFGKDAKARLEQLILNKYVYMGRDVKDKDKYNRSLRYIFLPEKRRSSQYLFVNAYMVGEGFGRAFILEKDMMFKDMINALQEQAITNKKGLWGSCDREKFRW